MRLIRGRRDTTPGPPDPSAVQTVIGKGSEIKGDIRSTTSVRVDGRLEGNLHTSGDVIVGESGTVVATIEAASILVAGEVQGQIKASARLEVAASGRVRGDVETPILVVNEGGRLDGNCSMSAERPAAAERTREPVPSGPQAAVHS